MFVVGFPAIVQMPCSSVVWAERESAESSIVAVRWIRSVCSELQNAADSLRERNVPLCGALWPEMPPQDTHIHLLRNREDKEQDTILCQHQTGSSVWFVSILGNRSRDWTCFFKYLKSALLIILSLFWANKKRLIFSFPCKCPCGQC